MRRAALIFLAAILLPCLALAWLAIRSEQDQQVILQHQQAIIDQGVTDALAQNVNTEMNGVLADFVATTRQLLARAGSPAVLADGFHRKLRDAWPLAQVGFAVDLQGTIYSPARSDGIPAQIFRKENGSFLSNREDAEVYANVQNQAQNILQNAEAGTDMTDTGKSATRVYPQAAAPQAPSTLDQPSTAAAPAMKAKLLPPAPSGSAGRAAPSPSFAMTDAFPSTAQPTGALETNSAPAAPVAPTESTATAAKSTYTGEAQAKAPAAEASDLSTTGGANDQADQQKSLPAPPRVAELKLESAPDADHPSPSFSVPAATPATALASPPPPLASMNSIARARRLVAPQENTRAPDAVLSNFVPAQSDFRQLIGQSTSGSIARFLEDRLCLLVWSLPAPGTIVFGAQLDQQRLVDRLRGLLLPKANGNDLDSIMGVRPPYCLALLDDTGRPVALSRPGFRADWKHPFVATEIGPALPHWEAALYLTDPGRLTHSARVLHFTIGLIILLLIVAILAGGSLIGADVSRQVRLAQQKTDFVSNVSHELKTPLTSIRMFADMLAEGRVQEPGRQATYLRIISAESARLTRLINNVLDFARLERGAPAGEHQPCDLAAAAREVVETCLPHLESAGVTLGFEVEAEPLPLSGDRDALSQIILNLISNAEKYGGGDIVVRVRRQEGPSGPLGCVDVLDRGPGIAPRQAEVVFAPFHRLDDSLAGGIPGSGLGLTLARRMARAHGGDVTYQPRAGGGSCFTLALPLSPAPR